MNFPVAYFYTFCFIWMGIAVAVHITMFFIKAPFGRHTSDKWGVSINNKAGWMIMEFPSLAIMIYFFLSAINNGISAIQFLFLCWILHYINRTIIYPLRIKPTPKKIPLFIVFNAIVFNIMNAGLNGFYLAEIANQEDYNGDYFSRPNFIAGFVLFLTGAFINLRSDTILIRLRKRGETGYKIPEGFLFNYISSPNLFGEITEWFGFALMAWNIPALTFFIWTYANLVPRAKNHHDWYLLNFENYPKNRKIIFPFLY